ncbi:hypothetical protein GCM10022239_03690 [Leifsonia bigeumensis]|uniref:Uncharacterized protein n=2 Tax=Leifsonella bigeumensis TaxID=433643 RepID=A0ABP7F2Q4_9MICO
MVLRTVPVTLPEPVWGRLASIADRRGVKVADLIADAVQAVVSAPNHDVRAHLVPVMLPPVEDRLAELNRELNAARASGWHVPRRDRKAAS